MKEGVLCFLGKMPSRSDSIENLLEKWRRIVYVVSDPKPQDLHPKISTYFARTLIERQLCARNIALEAIMEPLEIHAEEGWEEMRQALSQMHQTKHLLLAEVSDFGVQAHFNAVQNASLNGPYHTIASLKNALFQTPAIICGKGPSLLECIDDLEEMAPGAALFAAGNSVFSLAQRGIEPLFCCAIDKTTPENNASLFPEMFWAIQGRVSPNSVRVLQNRKVWAPESGPLPWEKGWGLDCGEFDCGWTAGNFATQLALFMGCNPIVCVGLDFCAFEKSERLSFSTLNRNRKEVWTQSDWMLSAIWQKQLFDLHPNIRWINASIDGLIPSDEASTLSLKELKGKERWPQRDCLALLHAAFEQMPSMPNPKNSLATWNESIEKSLIFCRRRQDFLLEKERAYRFYLEPLWSLWSPLFEKRASDQDLDLHRALFFQNALQQLISMQSV